MADLTKDELKAIFKAGAIPTEAQFASLIESQINKKDTGSLILSASSIDISGSAIAKTDIDLLKQGKSISSPTIASGSTSDEDNVDYTQYLRPQAVISDTDTSTYTKYTTPGRMATFVSGTLLSDLNQSSSNNYIALGATNTQLRLTGNITSSGNISASSGILYGRSLYLDADLIHSGDEDTKMTFGSDNITFNVGTIPLLTLTEDTQNLVAIGNTGDVDFQVKSGETNALFVQGSSGNTGLGLNNPGEKLTVAGNISASGNVISNNITASGGISASNLTVTGTTTFSSAQVGQRLTIKNLTATDETLTAAESGKLCLFSDADGASVTLPDSGDGSLVGVYYDFYVSVAATSNTHRINVADTTNEDIEGYLHTLDADAATAQATAAWKALNSDGFDFISMNGTTTGTIGTAFRITNVAADRWYITGHVVATGTPATPFNAS